MASIMFQSNPLTRKHFLTSVLQIFTQPQNVSQRPKRLDHRRLNGHRRRHRPPSRLGGRNTRPLRALNRQTHPLAKDLQSKSPDLKVLTTAVDVQDHGALSTAIANTVQQVSHIDILINNAGLALGVPSAFPDLKIQDIITMTGTNINGYMFATYAVLHEGKMNERGKGTILNDTSTTGLEVPPFPGEAVYHASKACQAAFTNVLRTELVGTDIKVLALRPGVVATNFHEQRYVDPISFVSAKLTDFFPKGRVRRQLLQRFHVRI